MGFLAVPAGMICKVQPRSAGNRARLAKFMRCLHIDAVEPPRASQRVANLEADGGILPAGYDAMGLERLEAQLAKLRSTVARRRASPGGCGAGGQADSIVAHYEKLIAGLEAQIRRLTEPQEAHV